jgi:hypothetical protein
LGTFGRFGYECLFVHGGAVFIFLLWLGSLANINALQA